MWHTVPEGGKIRWICKSSCAKENFIRSTWKTKVAICVTHFKELGSPRDFQVARGSWGVWQEPHWRLVRFIWSTGSDLFKQQNKHWWKGDIRAHLVQAERRYKIHPDYSGSGAMMGLQPGSMFIINLILLFPTQINFTTNCSFKARCCLIFLKDFVGSGGVAIRQEKEIDGLRGYFALA